MRKRFFRSGFTLVELSLSIAFISILSITIVVIINDMILSYQKGLVLKQINTTGTELVNDFRAAISSSSSSCDASASDDDCYKTIFVRQSADVEIGDDTINAPVYGAFCSGSYSYIWNSGYFFNESTYRVKNASAAELELLNNKTKIKDFRLLKILDFSRSICTNYKDNNNIFSISSATEEPIELLPSNSNLALYDLHISKPARMSQSDSTFYSGSFILATIQGGINIKASGNYCATPDNYKVENFNYCAINKFNFAMRASGV